MPLNNHIFIQNIFPGGVTALEVLPTNGVCFSGGLSYIFSSQDKNNMP